MKILKKTVVPCMLFILSEVDIRGFAWTSQHMYLKKIPQSTTTKYNTSKILYKILFNLRKIALILNILESHLLDF